MMSGDDLGVVHEAVDHRGGDHAVAEDLVAGDDQTRQYPGPATC
jgi:hypothetical protein